MVVVRRLVVVAFGVLVCALAPGVAPALAVTLTEPVVTTAPAQSVTRTGATLSGTVNPEGVATTYHYAFAEEGAYAQALEEGLSDPYAYGRTTAEVSIGSGSTVKETEPLAVEALAPGTVYHYAVVATTTQEVEGVPQHLVVVGPDETFTTLPPIPPIVSGVSVSGVTQSAAKIAATVDGRGLPTRWEVRLGSSQGNLEYEAAGHTAGEAESIEVALEQLVPGTVYHYKVVALNPDGASESSEGQFTTAAGPPPPALTPVLTTPLLAPSNIRFPAEPRSLTNREKLHKALRACQRKRSRGKRVACEKQARRRYGSKPGR